MDEQQKVLEKLLARATNLYLHGKSMAANELFESVLRTITATDSSIDFSHSIDEVAIKVALVLTKIKLNTKSSFTAAAEILTDIMRSSVRQFPFLYYILGGIYHRLQKFAKSVSVLTAGIDLLNNITEISTLKWPGTNLLIVVNTKMPLADEMRRLRRSSIHILCNQIPCNNDNCESKIISSRKLKIFDGSTRVYCSNLCVFTFHKICWQTILSNILPVNSETIYPKCLDGRCDGFIREIDIGDNAVITERLLFKVTAERAITGIIKKINEDKGKPIPMSPLSVHETCRPNDKRNGEFVSKRQMELWEQHMTIISSLNTLDLEFYNWDVKENVEIEESRNTDATNNNTYEIDDYSGRSQGYETEESTTSERNCRTRDAATSTSDEYVDPEDFKKAQQTIRNYSLERKCHWEEILKLKNFIESIEDTSKMDLKLKWVYQYLVNLTKIHNETQPKECVDEQVDIPYIRKVIVDQIEHVKQFYKQYFTSMDLKCLQTIQLMRQVIPNITDDSILPVMEFENNLTSWIVTLKNVRSNYFLIMAYFDNVMRKFRKEISEEAVSLPFPICLPEPPNLFNIYFNKIFESFKNFKETAFCTSSHNFADYPQNQNYSLLTEQQKTQQLHNDQRELQKNNAQTIKENLPENREVRIDNFKKKWTSKLYDGHPLVAAYVLEEAVETYVNNPDNNLDDPEDAIILRFTAIIKALLEIEMSKPHYEPIFVDKEEFYKPEGFENGYFSMLGQTDNTCAVCLNEIEEEDIFKLQCKHIFHKNCVRNLLSNDHVFCPTCRNDMFEQKDNY